MASMSVLIQEVSHICWPSLERHDGASIITSTHHEHTTKSSRSAIALFRPPDVVLCFVKCFGATKVAFRCLTTRATRTAITLLGRWRRGASTWLARVTREWLGPRRCSRPCSGYHASRPRKVERGRAPSRRPNIRRSAGRTPRCRCVTPQQNRTGSRGARAPRRSLEIRPDHRIRGGRRDERRVLLPRGMRPH